MPKPPPHPPPARCPPGVSPASAAMPEGREHNSSGFCRSGCKRAEGEPRSPEGGRGILCWDVTEVGAASPSPPSTAGSGVTAQGAETRRRPPFLRPNQFKPRSRTAPRLWDIRICPGGAGGYRFISSYAGKCPLRHHSWGWPWGRACLRPPSPTPGLPQPVSPRLVGTGHKVYHFPIPDGAKAGAGSAPHGITRRAKS